jgi:hypothetical protein
LNVSSNNSNLTIEDNLINGQKVFGFQEAPQFTSVDVGLITKSGGNISLNPLGSNRVVEITNADCQIMTVNKKFIGNLQGNADSATSATSATTAATATNALACSGNAATATLATASTNIAGGVANNLPYQSGVSTTSFLSSDLGALVRFNDTTGVPETVQPILLSVGSANIAGEATNLQSGAAGSLPYQTNISETAFLGIGVNNRLLASNGSVPIWKDPSSISVNEATNITSVGQGVLFNSAPSTTGRTSGLGTSGQVLVSAGSGTAPVFTDQSALSVGSATNSDNITGGSAGNILYQSASGTTAKLSNGTEGQVLVQGATNPVWTTVSIPQSLILSPTTTVVNIVPTQNTTQVFITSNQAINMPIGSGYVSFRLSMAAGTTPSGPIQFSFLLTSATNSAFTLNITSLNQGHQTAAPAVNGGNIVIPYVNRVANPTCFVRVSTYLLSSTFTAGNTLGISEFRIITQSAS